MAGGTHGADGVLARCFRVHGKLLSRRPFSLIFIALPIAAAAALAAGMSQLFIDSDPDTLWIPPDSTTNLQKRYFDAAYDPFFRIEQLLITVDDTASGGLANITGRRYYRNTTANESTQVGVLTAEFLLAALDLQTAIINGTAAVPSADAAGAPGTGPFAPPPTVTLNDLCYKPILGEGCLIETPLDYLLSDAAAIAVVNATEIQFAVDAQAIAALNALHPGYSPGWSAIHTPLLKSVILGGYDCLRGSLPGYAPSVCGGCGTYATTLAITFLLQSSPELADAAGAWEQDVFLASAAAWSYPGLRVTYMAQRSLQDEIGVLGSQNKAIVIISYAVMFVYIVLALGRFPHPVFTRALLGLQGIMIVIVSCVAAIGAVSWAGMHITMIVTEVLPFLILALGVDNVFILTKSFDRHWWGPFRGRYDPTLPRGGALVLPLRNPRVRRATGGGGGSLNAAAGASADASGVSAGDDHDHDDEDGGDVYDGIAASADGAAGGDGTNAPFLGRRAAGAASGAALDHDAVLRASIAGPVYRGECGVEGALSAALAEVGPTITAAAVCEVLAFGVGAATNIPALKQFCIVAAVAVAIDYALQLTWFASAIALDARRQEAHRFDVLPCCRGRRSPAAEAALKYAASGRTDRLTSALADSLDAAVAGAGGGKRGTSFAGASVAGTGRASIAGSATFETGEEDTTTGGGTTSDGSGFGWCGKVVYRGQYVRRFFATYYAPLLLTWPVRLLVLAAFGGMLGLSGYAATQLQLGLPQQLAVPSDSYLEGYYNDQSALGEAGPPLYLVLQGVNFSDPDTVPAVQTLSQTVGALTQWVQPPVNNWVSQFADWSSNKTRNMIAPHDSPSLADCPTPLDPDAYPLGQRMAQFLWDVPIMSNCCQKGAYCQGQFAYDVKFLWGVPKASPSPSPNPSPSAAPLADVMAAKSPVDAAPVLASPLDVSRDLKAAYSAVLAGTANGSLDAREAALLLLRAASGAGFEPRDVTAAASASGAAAAAAADGAGKEASAAALAIDGFGRMLAAPAPVPLPVSADEQAPTAATTATSSNDASIVGSASIPIDDGGCDLSFGYLHQSDVEAAIAHANTVASASAPASVAGAAPHRLTHRIALPGASLAAALPRERLARLEAALLQSPAGRSLLASSNAGGSSGSAGSRLASLPALHLIPCHVMTGRLRTQLTPLRNQSDMVGALVHVRAAVSRLQSAIPTADLAVLGIANAVADAPGAAQGVFVDAFNFTSDNEATAWLAPAPGGAAWPYSLTFVYYEQYLYIRGVALWNGLLTVGVVYAAAFVVTSSLAVAATTAIMVLCVTIDVIGFVWLLNPRHTDPNGLGPFGVDINAVSVVNLVAAIGLSVEFGVHVASYFSHARGTRVQRARASLVEMGSSVFTGITLTKLVGVSVLATAPSKLFQLYYFRMYLGASPPPLPLQLLVLLQLHCCTGPFDVPPLCCVCHVTIDSPAQSWSLPFPLTFFSPVACPLRSLPYHALPCPIISYHTLSCLIIPYLPSSSCYTHIAAIIIFGAFHGLAVLPVVLSIIGWPTADSGAKAAGAGRAGRRSKLAIGGGSMSGSLNATASGSVDATAGSGSGGHDAVEHGAAYASLPGDSA